jgi:hypothetical protein
MMKKSRVVFVGSFALAGAASLWLSANDSARAQNGKAETATAVTDAVQVPAMVTRNAPQVELAAPIQGPSYEELKEQARRRAAEGLAKAAERKADLERRAGTLRIPLKTMRADGGANRLLEITPEGEAFYVGPNNISAADTVNVDELWPSGKVTAVSPWPTGSTGYSLDGTGQTIGLWDPSGSVLTTHEQFGGRIVQSDFDSPPSPVAQHATWMAGTLTSAGISDFQNLPSNGDLFDVGNESTGAAFNANVHAYDTADITDELDAEFGAGTQLTTHSYGITSGWSFNGSVWVWYGSGSSQEDWKFGAYVSSSGGIAPKQLDSFSYNSPNTLLVFSAGDDRNEGPGHPVSYQLPDGTPQTATRDWNDGDDGGYDSLNPSACAKDVLTVGGVYDIPGGYSGPSSVVSAEFSSMGPTDDGRIKPDVVAQAVRTGTGSRNPEGFIGYVTTDYFFDSSYTYGAPEVSGTSFSAPTVCGGLALLMQKRAADRPEWVNNGYPMLSSTLRGLAIHTADQATTSPGPSYKFGYGLFDAAAAVNLMHQDDTSGDNPAANGPKPFVKEVQLNTTTSTYIQFKMHAVSSTTPLKATICWTDKDGTGQTTGVVDQKGKRLVNDLDLRIYPPGTTTFDPNAGSTFKPWKLNPDLDNKTAAVRGQAATTGDDSTNNVEQVVVSNPGTSGDYIVRVTYKGTLVNGNQWVSVLLAGNTIPAVDFRITSFIQQPDGSFIITWNAVVGGEYTVQVSNDLFTWTDALGPISANLESISMLVHPSGPYQYYRIKRSY